MAILNANVTGTEGFNFLELTTTTNGNTISVDLPSKPSFYVLFSINAEGRYPFACNASFEDSVNVDARYHRAGTEGDVSYVRTATSTAVTSSYSYTSHKLTFTRGGASYPFYAGDYLLIYA